MVRFASKDDKDFLLARDSSVKNSVLLAKIRDRQIYIAEEDEKPVGWARFNLFWDAVPFLTLIYILEGHRRKGHGTALMAFWERDMVAQGFQHLMTSTQADEQAQFFYRVLGFRDCGALFFSTQVPAEIFLIKDIDA